METAAATLFHHDSRPYEVAAAEAARDAKSKLQQEIDKGLSTGRAAIEKLFTEIPQDALAPIPRFEMIPGDGKLTLGIPGLGTRSFTDWSFRQLAEYLKTPPKFANELLGNGQWGAAALADLWTKVASHTPKKVLLRSVGDQLRGMLSDKFGRKDGRPIVESALSVAKDMGAVLIDGSVTETRFSFKFLSPVIHEPAPYEVVAFGAEVSGSDFGRGAINIAGLVDRLWCTNKATLRSELRSVHIGPRITEQILLSEETERLDLAALRSSIKDVLRYVFGPAQEEYLAALKAAAAEKLTGNEVRARLERVLDTKAEVKAAEELFASAEIEMLPPGQNTWRLSNVLSLLARDTDDAEQRIDYERAAGKLVLADAVNRASKK